MALFEITFVKTVSCSVVVEASDKEAARELWLEDGYDAAEENELEWLDGNIVRIDECEDGGDDDHRDDMHVKAVA